MCSQQRRGTLDHVIAVGLSLCRSKYDPSAVTLAVSTLLGPPNSWGLQIQPATPQHWFVKSTPGAWPMTCH
jgi:hypothetical protein